MKHRWFHLFVSLTVSAMLSGCASRYSSEPSQKVNLPDGWQVENEATASASWERFIEAQELEELLNIALAENHSIQRQALELDIARSALWQKKVQFWPSLDLKFSANRSGVENNSASITNSFAANSVFSYELNLWGQLSDEKKAAGYAYSAALADYEQAKRELVESVSSAWLNVVANQQLVDLRVKRLQSLEQNLAIIESGYRSGLNKALEVYLSRNNVESERSQLVQQQQSLSDARRTLSRLLGGYPSNTQHTVSAFPATNKVVAPELPSSLLVKRPDIRAAWLRVLQQNSTLAVAHKARFPALTLSASTGKTAADLSELGASNLAWSLTGSLVQPLINAGRLKSAEDSARYRLQQYELRYLETVYAAFQEVESALEQQVKLEQQLEATQNSADNALQAEKLSFEQYQKGIVSYSTVLEAQRRAVDAQIQLISLSKQIISNKIALLNAVNGELNF